MRRRDEVRIALIESFRRQKDTRVYGLPEDWRPDHPIHLVRRGYNQWRASGYQRMPSRAEIEAIEPTWESDLFFLWEVDQFINRDNE